LWWFDSIIPNHFNRDVMSKVDGLFWRQEVEIAKFSTPTILYASCNLVRTLA
jgi:hypothetical protein